MSSLYLPGAEFRPVKYRAEAGKFTQTPLGWILHTVVGNGSPFNTFQNAVSPNRRFSHAWVAKDGHAEQYQTLDMRSWAQSAGNGTYWSIETEGYPNEPLTEAQVTTLATFHEFLGVANELAESPGEKGVGTHYMGGANWGGHTCPDATPGAGPRSKQRTEILAAAAPVGQRGMSAPIPRSQPSQPTTSGVNAVTGSFPLPSGWYGVDDHTSSSHSGARSADRPAISKIQREVATAPDGMFGTNTQAKVKAWQKAHGLTADGKVGPMTWRKMASA